ncbi:MAG TPA: TlpA disulfide reductase family protein [Candidatus Krumholzibacteria bacterium]|nr:TlpA disulfide reductase family protein [Candidatus Krumholzibacteria bacterium]
MPTRLFLLCVLLFGACDGGGTADPGPSGPTTDDSVCPENSWPPCDGPAEDRETSALPGSFAPPVRGVDQFGDEVSLRQFRGTPVVLNVGATWCAPCREDAANFEEVRDFLSASLDAPLWFVEVLEDARSRPRQVDWANTYGIDEPVLGGEGAWKASVDLLIDTFPTKIVLDHEHRIVGRVEGSGQWEQVLVWLLEAERRRTETR